jgi:hypothetical protein
LVLTLYFFIQAYAGLFIFVKSDYKLSSEESFKSAGPFVASYFWLIILTSFLVFFWSLLFIIPGIIFVVFYSMIEYIFFFEGQRGMKALKRSKELVKGHWWAVAIRLLGFLLCAYIFMEIISFPLDLVSQKDSFRNFWDVIVSVITFIFVPIGLLFSYQIYRDLVNIKNNDH